MGPQLAKIIRPYPLVTGGTKRLFIVPVGRECRRAKEGRKCLSFEHDRMCYGRPCPYKDQ
jgi:hypothetical protein